jgi:hypothetical protein
VVNQWLHGLTLAHRPAQRLRDRLGVQAFMDVVAHDLPRKCIRHKTQIGHTFLSGQIGDVGHPDLFRAAGNNLIRPRLEQVRMASKAMMTVGCFVIRPLASYQ